MVRDAAKFYHGGITAYNIAQKFRHLNVEAIHALANDCVSEKIACEMAKHVAVLFTSNWGIGVTGYASPVTASRQKMYAWYAVAFGNEVKISGRIDYDKEVGPAAQIYYVTQVLKATEECI